MTELEKAARQALEALRFGLHVGFDESSESQIKKGGKAFDQHSKAITALRRALEQQPAEEPVAWAGFHIMTKDVMLFKTEPEAVAWHAQYTKGFASISALVRPQPAAQWVDLSFEDSEEIIGKAATVIEAVQMTEAKLREKNT